MNKRDFRQKVRKNKVTRLEKKQGVKSGSTFRSISKKKQKENEPVFDKKTNEKLLNILNSI